MKPGDTITGVITLTNGYWFVLGMYLLGLFLFIHLFYIHSYYFPFILDIYNIINELKVYSLKVINRIRQRSSEDKPHSRPRSIQRYLSLSLSLIHYYLFIYFFISLFIHFLFIVLLM